jgi:hypothetical protein
MHKLASCDVYVLLDDAQYTKNGWQNRNKIKGPQGPVLLTVPVRDPAFKPINEVEINNQTPWAASHWKSLLFNCGKAPYFRQYAEPFEGILAKRWDLLSSLNGHLIATLCRAFGIETPLLLSSSLGIPGHGTERLVQICQRLGASTYLTGAFAAGNHLDEQMFADAGINVVIQAWECPAYRQQFPATGFVPDLSAVDLLLNEGPSSLQILTGGPASVPQAAPVALFRP